MWWIIAGVISLPIALFVAAVLYEAFRKQPETTFPDYLE
jgi:Na+/proline symporter